MEGRRTSTNFVTQADETQIVEQQRNKGTKGTENIFLFFLP
jgi:hypothetical protein